jgi:hypothetical protein
MPHCAFSCSRIYRGVREARPRHGSAPEDWIWRAGTIIGCRNLRGQLASSTVLVCRPVLLTRHSRRAANSLVRHVRSFQMR